MRRLSLIVLQICCSFALLLFCSVAMAGTIQLPATGQKTMYIAGDDGDLERGVAWPSPRYHDNGNGTVTDNLTSLIWLKNSNCTDTVGGIPKSPGGKLSLANALTWSNSLGSGSCGLSDGSHSGDWRLPNREELESLIDFAYSNPAISNTAGTGQWTAGNPFTNVQSSFYWSSTSFAYGTYDAWSVDISAGDVGYSSKTDTYYVWPVRGGQSGPYDYFCDNDGDTYIDSSIDGTCIGIGCVPQGCQTTRGNDCNDSNAAIHPGATEICDGIDNNCNGQIDEGVKNTYYRDFDVDSYGNPATTTQSCSAPSGYVSDNTDCNDSNAAINPGATEICDGVDNNCNGQVDEGCSEPITNLVTDYYNSILGRAPEPGGAEYWTGEIQRIVTLGIDIKEGFIALGKLFFNSDEYMNMGTTDNEYVTDLYETFLGRTPTQSEVDAWSGELAGGLTRNLLLNYFIFSQEFMQHMTGIFGDTTVRPEYNLVNDLFRGFLSRLPDDAGFNYWLAQMQTAQCGGDAQAIRNLTSQMALTFLQSQEYIDRNTSNSEYIEDLYNGILRRGADLAGYQYWLGELNGGAYTREEMLQLFIDSAEFQARVQEVIDAGCAY